MQDWGNKENDGVRAESIADYLLEHGVLVPSVKIGDTVYAISRNDILSVTIDKIVYSNRGIDIFGSNKQQYFRTVPLDPDNKIGLEWYKTKEEAEKALKGGAE